MGRAGGSPRACFPCRRVCNTGDGNATLRASVARQGTLPGSAMAIHIPEEWQTQPGFTQGLGGSTAVGSNPCGLECARPQTHTRPGEFCAELVLVQADNATTNSPSLHHGTPVLQLLVQTHIATSTKYSISDIFSSVPPFACDRYLPRYLCIAFRTRGRVSPLWEGVSQSFPISLETPMPAKVRDH